MELYQHKVQYYETDQMGIVHHSNYIRWMEEARMDFLSQIGCDYKAMEDMGIISPVTSVECHYKQTTTFPDLVTIAVKVEEFKGVKLKLKYEMAVNDSIVCEGRSEHGFLTKDGKIISLKRSYPDIFNAVIDSMNA